VARERAEIRERGSERDGGGLGQVEEEGEDRLRRARVCDDLVGEEDVGVVGDVVGGTRSRDI
jgi:hypothetical protein